MVVLLPNGGLWTAKPLATDQDESAGFTGFFASGFRFIRERRIASVAASHEGKEQ